MLSKFPCNDMVSHRSEYGYQGLFISRFCSRVEEGQMLSTKIKGSKYKPRN